MIQGTFEYLNSPDGPESLGGGKAEKLTSAFVKFIEQVQADASDMVDEF